MKAVDLFCGVGGLSLGFERAGLNVVAAYDAWPKAVENYKVNFRHPVFECDLRDHHAAAKIVAGHEPDLIAGGPPCTDYSSAGKRVEGDKADLTISFANIVSEVRSTWFVMENVARAWPSDAYQQARAILKGAAYGLSENVLDASLCGVPQRRRRFFCIGKLEERDGFLDPILAAGQAGTPMTLRDYCGGDLDFENYYRHPRNFQRRAIFSIDEPSATIRGVNRPIPPAYIKHAGDTAEPASVKPLSFSMRARVQTFPTDYRWIGCKTELEQMVGNAVPVELARYVASAIIRYG
jgi:DNA (cytosine-5)-methyltransferase 1